MILYLDKPIPFYLRVKRNLVGVVDKMIRTICSCSWEDSFWIEKSKNLCSTREGFNYAVSHLQRRVP